MTCDWCKAEVEPLTLDPIMRFWCDPCRDAERAVQKAGPAK